MMTKNDLCRVTLATALRSLSSRIDGLANWALFGYTTPLILVLVFGRRSSATDLVFLNTLPTVVGFLFGTFLSMAVFQWMVEGVLDKDEVT